MRDDTAKRHSAQSSRSVRRHGTGASFVASMWCRATPPDDVDRRSPKPLAAKACLRLPLVRLTLPVRPRPTGPPSMSKSGRHVHSLSLLVIVVPCNPGSRLGATAWCGSADDMLMNFA